MADVVLIGIVVLTFLPWVSRSASSSSGSSGAEGTPKIGTPTVTKVAVPPRFQVIKNRNNSVNAHHSVSGL